MTSTTSRVVGLLTIHHRHPIFNRPVSQAIHVCVVVADVRNAEFQIVAVIPRVVVLVSNAIWDLERSVAVVYSHVVGYPGNAGYHQVTLIIQCALAWVFDFASR